MKKIVWIDDIRNPFEILNIDNTIECVWINNYQDAIEYIDSICSTDTVEFYLDNDLSDSQDRQGKHVLNYIEEKLFYHELKNLKTIYIHSDNASAVRMMMSAKQSFNEKYNVNIERLLLTKNMYQRNI